MKRSSITVALLAMAPVVAAAQTVLGDNAFASTASVAVGFQAIASGGGAVAIGDSSGGEGYFSVAVGSGATATGHWGAAVGESASANGWRSISIGASSNSFGSGASAVGTDSYAHGFGSSAFGYGSQAAASFYNQSQSLGGDTALGSYSLTLGDNGLAAGYTATAGYAHDACPPGYLPVDGVLGAGCSTDGTSSSPSVSAVRTIYGARATSLGSYSAAQADNSLAVGSNAFVDYRATGAVAIGSGSRALEAMTVSFGDLGSERRLVNVSAGINATDAVNKAQLDLVSAQASAAQATANAALAGGGGGGGGGASSYKVGTSAIGSAGTVGSISNIAQGEIGQTATITSTGAIVMATGTASTAQASLTLTNGIGNTHGIVVEEAKTVLSGGTRSTSLVLDDNGAKFSDSATGEAVVVGGVADGVEANDAVNRRQLDAQAARISEVAQDVRTISKRVDEVERKAYAGAAAAAALAQPAMFAPDATSAATVGVATYGGQHAVAVGYNRLMVNSSQRKMVVFAGVAASTGCVVIRAGGSFSW